MIRVSVFGSSRAIQGSSLYQDAYDLGYHLVKAGFEVSSGGYGGTMEAVSRGSRDAGGSPIGITFEEFGNEPNEHVGQHLHEASLFTRIERLILEADAFVIMNGGMGTLAEFALAWIHLEGGLSHKKPLILVGNAWNELLNLLTDHFTVSPQDLVHLDTVSSVTEAISLLQQSMPKTA